jgi:hypothetical protein
LTDQRRSSRRSSIACGCRSLASGASRKQWPLQKGFDRFYGTIHGAGSFFDPNTLARDNQFISPYADPQYQPKEPYYYTDALSDHAVRFDEEVAPRNGYRPAPPGGVGFAELVAKAFDPGRPAVLSVWGHSYEFGSDSDWKRMEFFCQLVGKREDVWYATNIEITDYLAAAEKLTPDSASITRYPDFVFENGETAYLNFSIEDRKISFDSFMPGKATEMMGSRIAVG